MTEINSTNSKILITVNGENINIPVNSSVSSLLEILKINENKIVVEHNKEIVTKENYKTAKISENDLVEIVTFVGGG